MANILSIEKGEKLLPVMCIFGYMPNFREELVKLNSKKFRIIIVGTRKPNFLEDYPEVYFLTYKNAKVLSKLEERVDYSIVFLSDQDCIKNISFFTEKVSKDKSQTLAVLTPGTLAEDLTNLSLVKSVSNLRVCMVGEILTPKRRNESDLSKIIENAILNQEIKLSGNASEEVFCITLDDATTAIQRLLFGNFRKEVFYYLFYKHPETILEATHLIAKVEPETKILFSDSVSTNEKNGRENFQKLILDKTGMDISYIDSLEGFEKGMEKFFAGKKDFTEALLQRSKRKKRRKANSPFYKALKLSVISFAAGVFLFAFMNLLFLGLGMLYLRQSISSIENGKFSEAAVSAKRSNFFLTIIKPTIELTFEAISSIDKQGQTQQTYRLLRKAGELSEIGGSTISNILKSTSFSESQLLSSIANFSFIYQEGERINSKTKNTSLSKELKTTYSNFLSLSQVLPFALGFEGDKNYLVLFQNNEELRPTGGFIGSVGDLTIKEGKISEFKIFDVYDLDGQLKNHIEPPFAVRRYLQPHLYLRDSNFGLDFQETASKSAFIYNLETGKEPIAVVAVDLNVLKEILKISGPISLSSYNVTVDDKTISHFLQSTIKENFFPGSTQKKDVLNSVFSRLVERVEHDPKFNVSLIKLLPELLEKKDILIAFSDNSIQKVFSANGYAGSYSDTRVKNNKHINDYLYVNEANIGVNKVNSLVSRILLYRATIGQESLVSEATLVLTNASKADDYISYLTFVLPGGSTIKKIFIDGVEQSLSAAVTDPQIFDLDNFVVPTGLEVEQYAKDGLTHVSFKTAAAKNKRTEIKVQYENGAKKNLSSISKYSLLLIKQPGVEPFSFLTSFEYPEGYSPVGISADSYGTNFLEKGYTIADDLLEEFELQKKQ